MFNPLSLLTGGLVKSVGKIIDDVSTSDEERGAIENERRRIALAEATLRDRASERQVEVNREEARHKSVFVAGWRAAVGWTCVAGIFYKFVFFPIFADAFLALGYQLREIDVAELMALVTGMLGMAGWRSMDKRGGVATDRLRQ